MGSFSLYRKLAKDCDNRVGRVKFANYTLGWNSVRTVCSLSRSARQAEQRVPSASSGFQWKSSAAAYCGCVVLLVNEAEAMVVCSISSLNSI